MNLSQNWQNIFASFFGAVTGAENFATDLERFPENKLWDDFSEGKYGNYFRNIQGIIEHTHYHLGQIVFIKNTFR